MVTLFTRATPGTPASIRNIFQRFICFYHACFGNRFLPMAQFLYYFVVGWYNYGRTKNSKVKTENNVLDI